MIANKILAMSILIGDGSKVLKASVLGAVISLFLVLVMSDNLSSIVFFGLGLTAVVFANLILVTNAHSMLNRNTVNLFPDFRAVLTRSILIYCLLTLGYFVCISLSLNGALGLTGLRIFSISLLILSVFLMFWAIAICFDRRAVKFLSMLLMAAIILSHNFELQVFSSWRELTVLGWVNLVGGGWTNLIVGSLAFASGILLGRWRVALPADLRILSKQTSQLVERLSNIQLSQQPSDSYSFRKRQNIGVLIFSSIIVLIVALTFGDIENPLRFAFRVIIVEVLIILIFMESSVFSMRYLWLRGIGNRPALLALWERRKLQDILLINMSFVVVNVFVFALHSLRFSLFVFMVTSVLALSIFTLYVQAFASIKYWNPSLAKAGVGITVVTMSIIAIHFKVENILLLLILVGLSLFIRLQARRHIVNLDWLKMHRPSRYGDLVLYDHFIRRPET